MKVKIKLTEKPYPMGGCSIYRPDFRDMAIEDIENELQESLQSYADVGYNSFTFNRPCGIISINRISIKTLDDVFNTDMYGLLTDTGLTTY